MDYSNEIHKLKTKITGEFAFVFVQVPSTYTQVYGSQQYGGFLDIAQPIYSGKIFRIENSSIVLAARFEYLDRNVGVFRETGDNIFDDMWSITGGLNFRASQNSVLKLNYLLKSQRDILGNDMGSDSGFIFGMSTYF